MIVLLFQIYGKIYKRLYYIKSDIIYMEITNMNNYKRGLIAGIPIAIGYLSVSFTFGIMAVSFGLSWWQAVLISMTTVTSAGQFAGIGTMMHPGQYIQMLISQITINIRY